MNINQDLKHRIRLKLIEFPELRDNDNMLMAEIWKEDIKSKFVSELFLNEIGLETFFMYLEWGELTSAESCRRYRAMIQEKHPELRGKNYLKRHKFAEEVKEEIINSK
jgi:hypothetical protein